MTSAIDIAQLGIRGELVMLHLLAGATLILLLAGAAVLILHRRSAALRHRVWTLGMTALLPLPVLALLLPDLGPQWQPVRDSDAIAETSDAPSAGGASRRGGNFENANSANPSARRPEMLATKPSAVEPYDRPHRSRNGGTTAASEDPTAGQNPAPQAVATNVRDNAPMQSERLSSPSGNAGRSIRTMLVVVWLAGVVLGWFTFLRSWISVSRMVRRAVPVTAAEVIALNEQIRQSAGVSDTVPLLCSSQISVPLTVGCLRPVILLPAGFGQWTHERCRVVLAHEMAHIRRRDVLSQTIARLACCLYWCHPLVWVANWRMRVEREFACDDAVLELGEMPAPYAGHLVDVAAALAGRSRPPQPAVAMASRSTLEQRVRAILHPNLQRTPVARRTSRALLLCTLAIVVLIGLMSPSVSEDVDAEARESDKPATTAKEKVGDNRTTEPAANSNDKPTTAAESKTVDSPVGDRASLISEDGYVRTKGSMQIRVIDPDGQPLPGATVYAKRIYYETDSDGVAEIKFDEELRLLRIWVRKEGHVPQFIQWWPEHQEDGHLIPEEYTVQLPKGTVIGGVIQNDDGDPILGVKVEVGRESTPSENIYQRLRPDHGLAGGDEGVHSARTTDSQGRWSLDNVPPGADVKVSVKLSHPDYIGDLRSGDLQQEQHVSMKSLRDQTAVIVMSRGTQVTGRVTTPDGKPVPEAVVVWANDGRVLTSDQAVTTDEDGIYSLPTRPPGEVTVTVAAEGWMPETKQVKVAPDMDPIDFALKSGKKLRIRFVDSARDPVPGVTANIESWRGEQFLYNSKTSSYPEMRIPRKADENGIYEWNWAPEGELMFNFVTSGYAYVTDAKFTADGTEQNFVLHRLLTISGNATDAQTGAAIDRFHVVPVHYFRQDFLYVNRTDAVEGRDGRFEIEFDRTDIDHGIRAEAIGYRTQVVGSWSIDEPAQSVDIQLEPAEPVRGVVVGVDGQSISNARVFLCTYTQEVDIVDYVREERSSDNFLCRTNDAGRFEFPAQYEPFTIIAIDDSGYAERFYAIDEKPGELKLQPWARIEGQLLQGGEPVEREQVYISPLRPRFPPHPQIDSTYWQETDEHGRFVFERVPPVKASLKAYLTVWKEFSITSGESLPLDLQPGETRKVELGGNGAEVTGRVHLTGETRSEIDLNYSLNYLVALRDGVAPPEAVAEKGFHWKNGWSDAWTSTSEGQAYRDTLHHYFVKLNRDGTLRISGVPPGEYELALKIYEPPVDGCVVQPVATHQFRFEVSDGHVQRGLDLGEIDVEAFLGPQVGDAAPNIAFETLEGTQRSLSDLAGKYVLIDVWATWCGPCVAKLPVMREIHAEFATNDNLVVLGLNLDRDPKFAREFVNSHHLPWQHGFLGDWSESKFPVQYGISSIPAYLLIDPDGNLVHKGHQAEEIREVVQAALDATSP